MNTNFTFILSELRKQHDTLQQMLACLLALASGPQASNIAESLQSLRERHRQRDQLLETLLGHVAEIAGNTKPMAAPEGVTGRKIYKQEVLELLKISKRTYDRHKASGLLRPRGIGYDFYYPSDLEKAMAESRRRGRV